MKLGFIYVIIYLQSLKLKMYLKIEFLLFYQFSFMIQKIIKQEIEENLPKIQPRTHNHKSIYKRTTLLFLTIGFYFLIFALIQFITNTKQNYYQYQLTCIQNNCSTTTDFLRFQYKTNVSIYLIVEDINQNDIQIKNSYSKSQIIGNVISAQNCGKYFTNLELNQNVSVNAKKLIDNNQAIPCGFLAYLFPQGQLYLYSVEKNQNLTIHTDNIMNPYFQRLFNMDLDKQWIDMTNPHFQNWMKISVSQKVIKYYGVLIPDLTGNIIVSLILQRNVIHKYKIIFEDNRALGGYNPPLFYFNLFGTLLSFTFSILSYYFNITFDQQRKILPNCTEHAVTQE